MSRRDINLYWWSFEPSLLTHGPAPRLVGEPLCQLQRPPRVSQVHCPHRAAGLAAEEDDAMGTIFEDACLIFLDTVVVDLMVRLDETEGSMRKRHGQLY